MTTSYFFYQGLESFPTLVFPTVPVLLSMNTVVRYLWITHTQIEHWSRMELFAPLIPFLMFFLAAELPYTRKGFSNNKNLSKSL